MKRSRAVLYTASILGAATIVMAGDLIPPAGPVAPTMKALSEVEPRIAINAANTPGDANSTFKITQPGSYYLTGNITGAAGRHGIEIGNNDVTIDLMGHTLRGVGGSLDGVSRDTGFRNSVRIVNGVIRDWGGDGVDLTLGSGFHLEDLRLVANGGNGASLDQASVIVSCVATDNGLRGLNAGTHCEIRGCAAYQNGTDGIGFTNTAAITDCVASSNMATGIFGGGSGVVSRCVVSLNTTIGIRLFDGMISDCNAGGNFGDGIVLLSGGMISDCVSENNGTNGIVAGQRTRIVGNSCQSNGLSNASAGIQVTGSDNVIDSNTCASNGKGIDVDGTGNVIIRNTCTAGVSSYDIVANNRYGPIVNVPSLGTAAVNGDIAPSTMTTTDPLANFSY